MIERKPDWDATSAASQRKRQKYIPIFIDWKPDENLEPGDHERLCMVGLIASSMEGMPGLASYKKTRTKKRKLNRAQQLYDHLKEEKTEVDIVAVTGMSDGAYARWAIDAINRVRPKIGGQWRLEGTTPVAFEWNGNIYPRANALGISLYAGILPLVALRAKIRLENAGQQEKDVKLCLDRLPLDAEAGIRLLKAFLVDDEIAEMWADTRRGGYSFESGILESYVDENGVSQPGKKHPNSNLVDWMAQACMATVAPGEFQKENEFSDSEVEQIAALWTAVENQCRGSASITDVDDPELIAKVTMHWAERGGKL